MPRRPCGPPRNDGFKYFLNLSFFCLFLFILPGCSEEAARERLVIRTASGKEAVFNIELALTPEEQARGLMHRRAMPEDAGLLFVFEQEKIASFWMKNTLIPLDMIFIGSEGMIRHIHRNARPHDLGHVSSQVPVKAVLEIGGGLSDKFGIAAGNKIFHSAFGD